MNVRKDRKGRRLLPGEIQREDGRYAYRFTDTFGRRKVVYSWRLTETDPVPKGKRVDVSLREKEKRISHDLTDQVSTMDGKTTVLELVVRYDENLRGLRPTTMAGHKTVRKLLERDSFGMMEIDSVRTSTAKRWMAKLQEKDGKSFSSLHTIRGVLRPAFQMAVDDDLIRKNPFDFQMATVLINDAVRRDALSNKDEERFLEFIKNDSHYAKFYDGVYVLFHTGMRISEFVGLTVNDIDLWNKTITIRRQLLYTSDKRAYIQQPKTESGNRTIPIDDDLLLHLRRIVEKPRPKIEPMIGGVAGFLYITRKNTPFVAHHWEKIFQRMVEKHNSIYKNELPNITPHICRHTHCTRLVKRGLSAQTVQYLMGHADPSTTFRIYTHFKYEDVAEELMAAK